MAHFIPCYPPKSSTGYDSYVIQNKKKKKSDNKEPSEVFHITFREISATFSGLFFFSLKAQNNYKLA